MKYCRPSQPKKHTQRHRLRSVPNPTPDPTPDPDSHWNWSTLGAAVTTCADLHSTQQGTAHSLTTMPTTPAIPSVPEAGGMVGGGVLPPLGTKDSSSSVPRCTHAFHWAGIRAGARGKAMRNLPPPHTPSYPHGARQASCRIQRRETPTGTWISQHPRESGTARWVVRFRAQARARARARLGARNTRRRVNECRNALQRWALAGPVRCITSGPVPMRMR